MMMYCTQCGTGNGDDARFCVNCGAPLAHPTSTHPAPPAAPAPSVSMPPAPASPDPVAAQPGAPAPEQDTDSFGWSVLGFFVPVAGLILWLVWRGRRPRDSRRARNGFIAGIIVNVIAAVAALAIGLSSAASLSRSAGVSSESPSSGSSSEAESNDGPSSSGTKDAQLPTGVLALYDENDTTDLSDTCTVSKAFASYYDASSCKPSWMLGIGADGEVPGVDSGAHYRTEADASGHNGSFDLLGDVYFIVASGDDENDDIDATYDAHLAFCDEDGGDGHYKSCRALDANGDTMAGVHILSLTADRLIVACDISVEDAPGDSSEDSAGTIVGAIYEYDRVNE
ncbi:zinc ribbon domain-containing protein [Bifidobacterium sp. CP2]|uniref:zinc ribbon domain-containing protein n=1 Tax=Bifidobacterium sp. CP2 TaxID=2809025 RepID=UPI001BDC2D12|nr:zinc ribbon domain-containing protein [Bifidobacterium sp. CP2]MBT1180422.1 zinc ribbon domain-containing protein [Bifidobacterium sp. CP2]